jgi:hypothetical protein
MRSPASRSGRLSREILDVTGTSDCRTTPPRHEYGKRVDYAAALTVVGNALASSNGLRRTGFVERLPVLKTVIELPLVIHSHTVIHTHHEAG